MSVKSNTETGKRSEAGGSDNHSGANLMVDRAIGPNTYTGIPGGHHTTESLTFTQGRFDSGHNTLSWTPQRGLSHSGTSTIGLSGLRPEDTTAFGTAGAALFNTNISVSGSAVSASEDISPITRQPVSVPRRIPNELNVIGHLMSVDEIAAQLENHGCQDITTQLDLSTCSTWPVSSGGFGDIYKVKLLDSTEVAVKTTRVYVSTGAEGEKSLKHAARELHTWSKCNHRNVLKLLGLAVFRGQIGMVSLWMAHGSLPMYLSKYPQADRHMIITQICEGLTYLHASNIVHGDLKGMNVLVSADGIPVLSDFGNAVLNSQTLHFTATTNSPAFSLRWTAPEILCSEGLTLASKPADIYSLGMTILEIITGKPPYPEKSDQAVMFCVWRGTYPDRPEEIPDGSEQGDILWTLLCLCWSKKADERPRAAEVTEVVGSITRDGLLILPSKVLDARV
ncbi:Ephrin type-A receptor 7 [Rhizoctonia solani]|uniref:Ephrin type-A receptor 7 n=1 Tax=Rhizoctonia solani TaxID=456999 RepID=A0A0K6FU50_9AGAM|nr:Ephrin type-A receptor 7 [Rhizoctonia solani]